MTEIPTTGKRTELAVSIKEFLQDRSTLHLGGHEDFHQERRHHLEVFGFHALPEKLQAPIGRVEFTAVRGRHGTVPVRLFYPKNFEDSHRGMTKGNVKIPAMVYMHGGGYTVGSVDEFENGLRLLAEKANMITIGVEYHLAPEWPFPTQLDDYEDALAWAQGSEGASRGIDGDRVLGGGDSAGGNMTAALSLRLKDEGKKPMKAQMLLYPEARLPFDTPAASENNSGLYLECNGIFSFADHYLPRAPNKFYPPAHRYVSPGMQPVDELKGVPAAAVFTCGFDPLRDVGVEYASKLKKAGNKVHWHHYPDLTHGFLQMAPWSSEASNATAEVAEEMKKLASA
ncbi:putative Alpha/beta hydrolase fold-3 domain-containing protein [Seiridium cardinale]|uniref:Alpha/beta hydrolase fold-3 domain-containing protein n=1 Tax=Seiridium cardinale TaxID=138064 RepID=A0ABR2XR26_9PEZI